MVGKMGTFRTLLVAGSIAMLSTSALGMSVTEVASKCGDDAKEYCSGVGYGDAMTQCLSAHHAKLKPDCGSVVDRIKNGENVSLF